MRHACSSRKVFGIIALMFGLLGPADAQEPNRRTDGNKLPRVFCLIPVKLAESKARVRQGDKSLQPAM